jgi:hypothetical protein
MTPCPTSPPLAIAFRISLRAIGLIMGFGAGVMISAVELGRRNAVLRHDPAQPFRRSESSQRPPARQGFDSCGRSGEERGATDHLQRGEAKRVGALVGRTAS